MQLQVIFNKISHLQRKQDSYVKKNISNVNKSKYFKQLVTEGLIKERTSNSQYFEIANSIKPSTHKKIA